MINSTLEVFQTKVTSDLLKFIREIFSVNIFPSIGCVKGLKPQLVARLSKVLKTEENESLVAAENQNESNAADDDEAHTTSGGGDGTAGAGSNNSNDMHESASNDSIDIDMADIVVIDEYDSTKNDNKNESSSKRVCIH